MLLLTLSLVATVLIIYFFRLSLRNLNYWKERGVKYIKPLPVFGNMLPMVMQSMSMPQFIQHLYNAFPKERYMGFYQFLTPILLVRDPELIKTITIKNFENFVDHSVILPDEADPLWVKNLFSSQGERWKDLRQTLSPAFTSSKMRAMFVLMDECTRQLVAYFEEQSQEVIEVDLKDIFSRYTTDVIATTAFGIKCDSLKFKNNDFLLAGRELSDFTGFKRFKFLMYSSWPRLAIFLRMKIISDRVGNFFKAIINETITLRENKNIIRPDLIHLLMLARNGKLKYEEHLNFPDAGFAAVQESEIGKTGPSSTFLSNEDITAQAVIFFLGGFDTVSTLMSFATLELALNPHIQRKLKAEIIKNSRKITYEELLDLKYLDMVISETLRKWSQAIWVDRKCTKAFEIEPERDGEVLVKVNEGDICWLPIFAIHRDSQYYSDPDVFDPERFNEENKEKIQTSTYLPFGMGPRNCIGSRFALLETKILLYRLLLDFDFIPTQKTPTEIKIRTDSTMMLPENGFYVGLRRRQ